MYMQEEVVATVEAICARHGIEEFCVAGHSYGTIWAGGWLVLWTGGVWGAG